MNNNCKDDFFSDTAFPSCIIVAVFDSIHLLDSVLYIKKCSKYKCNNHKLLWKQLAGNKIIRSNNGYCNWMAVMH